MSILHLSRFRSGTGSPEGVRPARILLACLGLAVALAATGCRSIHQQEADSGTEDNLPDQEAWNSTIYLSRDGRQEATIKAGHRVYFADSNVTVMDEGVFVRFYDETGSLASTLEADNGEIDGLTHNLRARGNVTVFSVERGTLETDSLTWINNDNLIRTDAAVKLTNDRDIVSGEGFEADPSLRRWIIHHQVKGRFLPGTQTD